MLYSIFIKIEYNYFKINIQIIKMNVIHELRNHYLKLREKEIRKEYSDYKDQQQDYSDNFFKNSIKNKEFKEPRDINLFKNKLNKHIHKKNNTLEIPNDNLQTSENPYFNYENLWNMIINDDDIKEITLWGKLNNEKRIIKLNEFVDEYTDINSDIKEQLKNDLKKKLESGFFTKNKCLLWNKYQNKIYKIKNLVILEDDFYWE